MLGYMHHEQHLVTCVCMCVRVCVINGNMC